MLTLDPYQVKPGSILDELFELKAFGIKQTQLLGSAVKFDVVWHDGTVTEVQFSSEGSQLGAPLATQIYEKWFEQESKMED